MPDLSVLSNIQECIRLLFCKKSIMLVPLHAPVTARAAEFGQILVL